ncbi:hypothetical protein Raf01_91970 [Rugosimonospora africana]|uniref:Uncharacterized protein n=1 Tax=Rugosimonospora africana TaxID=556532 RepID=A0A8J3VW65_9ACTN|nr:hypothetical protein Raf01_91970 [Rugosimonospora africana]
MGPTNAAATVVRLRPAVHVSPTPDGIYVRGWNTAFTVVGGADLWRLWQRLEPALRRGVATERLAAAASRPALLKVLRELVSALRDHDLTLPVVSAWRDDTEHAPPPLVADWLEQLAADPAVAWHQLAATTVDVAVTGDAGSAVADAAISALLATGVQVSRSGGVALQDPAIVALTAQNWAVFAGIGEHRGFATHPAAPDEGAATASRVAIRLGVAGRPARATAAPQPLAAVLGAAATERLLRVVAGLPDPGRGPITAPAGTEPAGAAVPAGRSAPDTLPDSWPMVLVARAKPFTVGYHPWLADGGDTPGPADSPDVVLARLDALCDPELGVLPVPRYEDLPQVPAALAMCEADRWRVLGTGDKISTARLDATLGGAERLLNPDGTDGPDGTGRLAVGIDDQHATGRLLRRAAYQVAGRAAATAAGPGTEHRWRDDPAARRWWITLTIRCGLDARLGLARLADGAFAARVEVAGRELAWAVEASAGTAVANAALGAVAMHEANRAGLEVDAPVTVCRAVSAQPSDPPLVGPATDDRAVRRVAEQQLIHGLRRFVPRGRQLRPAPPGRHEVGLALRAVAFCVWELG